MHILLFQVSEGPIYEYHYTRRRAIDFTLPRQIDRGYATPRTPFEGQQQPHYG